MYYKRIICLLTVLLAYLSVLLSPPVFASSDSLYLSPSSETVYNGYTVSLTISARAGDTTNAVQANLSYPTSKLQYLSTSYSSSAFEIQAQSTGGGGSIQIARGTLSPFSGTRTVAVVSFRALTNSGSAAVSFSGGSVLVNNGAALPTGTSGSTIYFANVPPPAPVAPAPPPPVVDTTPPTISNISTGVTQTSAVISWQTNEPSDSSINYGVNANYGLSVTSSNKVTKHSLTLSSSFLSPNTTYHYQIASTDSSGNKRTDTDRIFTTAPIIVDVYVHNSKGKAIANTQVTFDGQIATTNQDGVAEFHAGIGEHTVLVNGQTAPLTKYVAISANNIGTKPVGVNFSLAKPAGLHIPSYVWVIDALIIGIILGYILSNRGRLAMLLFKATGKLPGNISNMRISSLQQMFGNSIPARNPYTGSLLRRLPFVKNKTNKKP